MLRFLVILLIAASAVPAWADSPEARFVAGLRARRLFRLAEQYCTQQVRRSDLSPARRAEVLMELARTYGEHALHAPPGERQPLWDEAHAVVGDYLQAFPDSPRRLLIELQDALTWLAQGELARQEAQVVSGQEPLVEQARQSLRRAASALEQIAEEVEIALRQQLRRPNEDGQTLSATELAALEKNVAYQLARVYRNQAECYPPGSPDRANSLTQALERLTRLAQLAVADAMVWRARLDRVTCARLLGDLPQASQALTALVQGEPPVEIALQAQAEKIRLLLASDQVDAALAAVEQGRTLHGESSADLDFAHVEALVAAWKKASASQDADEAARWQRRAALRVQQIEREHGPYWMRRAEMLLGRSVGTTAGDDVEALARAAASLYRSGQIDEALSTYDRATTQARNQNARERAFELAFTAAAIAHEQGRHAEAARRFRALAHAQPEHARAGEAHRLAIVNLAQQARSGTEAERAAALAAYRAALEAHLQRWPNDPSADAVRRWLGDLHRARSEWPQAVALYKQVSRGSEPFAAVVPALAESYAKWIAAQKAAGEPHTAIAHEAAEHFQKYLSTSAAAGAENDSPVDRFCALTAAKMLLDAGPNGAAEAERVLAQALEKASDAPAAWRSEAATRLVYALAVQGRHDEAARVMDRISSGSTDGLIGLLETLNALAAEAPPTMRGALAGLQLRTLALLEPRRAELREDQRKAFDTGRAAALRSAGRTAEALRAYEQLAETYPEDGDVQQARAELLQNTTDPATLRQALKLWREIESKSRPGGERWFTARYAQAEALYRLGEKEQAAKLVRLTAVLHPELGGAVLRAKFERLLTLCQ